MARVASCVSCGEQMLAGAEFCPQCGAAVRGPTAAPMRLVAVEVSFLDLTLLIMKFWWATLLASILVIPVALVLWAVFGGFILSLAGH